MIPWISFGLADNATCRHCLEALHEFNQGEWHDIQQPRTLMLPEWRNRASGFFSSSNRLVVEAKVSKWAAKDAVRKPFSLCYMWNAADIGLYPGAS